MANLKFHISIPTLNSAETIGRAIDSVLAQTYKNYTVNLVDSFSKDITQEIAENKGVRVILYRGKLLGARYEGFTNEDCDYAIFMDSDQVLAPDLLQKLNDRLAIEPASMVILEEHSYKTETPAQKMYDLDRTIVQKEYTYNVSPENGVLLPRVFKKSLLTEAFAKIDTKLYPEVVAHDHAIIYYEAYKLSPSIIFLPRDAVFHQEPRSLYATFWHFVSYGRNTRKFEEMGLYTDLINNKMSGRNRGLTHNLFSRKLFTLPLLASKWLGYKYGYHKQG